MDEAKRLLERFRSGEKWALDLLLERERMYLRRFIELRLDSDLRGRIDPSDVIQETLVAVANRIEEIADNPSISFRLWVRRKAADKIKDLRRKHFAQKRSVQREIHLTDASSMLLARGWADQSPSDNLQCVEQAARVRQALNRLDETDREVILLRHVEELNSTEVAEVLGISSNTANKRYGRAVKRLAATLRQMEGT